MDNQPQDINQLTYEQASKELETIVAALEAGEQPLDIAITLFERGQILIQRCNFLLDQAELKVRQINGGELEDFIEP